MKKKILAKAFYGETRNIGYTRTLLSQFFDRFILALNRRNALSQSQKSPLKIGIDRISNRILQQKNK